MESFTWEDCFVTGLSAIDEQHHGLVDLINRFGEQVVRADEAIGEATEQVINELAAYAKAHFRDEEALMSQARLDHRHVIAHHQEHQHFLQELARLHGVTMTAESGHEPALTGELGAAGRHYRAQGLLQFLSNWLAYHILGSDQAMAAQMSAMRAGSSASQAHEASQHVRDPATATLLRALDRLFRQMSDHNRALHDLNRTLEARVAERTRELSESNQRLRDMALTDSLTGLANRRHAMRLLHQEWQLADARLHPLACLMLDADDFKRINDQFGHDGGDAVLQELARRVQSAVRTDDTVCRLGGDEFLVICPRTPLAGALDIAEKLRLAVAASPLPAGTGVWRGSVSLGVAVRGPGMAVLEDLLKAADAALYEAKRGGRNRVASTAA